MAKATAAPIREMQRPPAEMLYADELSRLAARDAQSSRPDGWLMSPQSVVRFVLGDEELQLQPKFVGARGLVERCVVSLATQRGLLLIGEPGTAKSYLSELLAAGISGDSTLTIQGSAGTTEDNIKYSWNYALLLTEGASESSLVPAPLHRGMSRGKIVRFEEITRCPLEIQDCLLSVLSDRVMAIPELPGDGRNLFARAGFNIVATANTRDRGINEMSAALKRRFNFETIPPISSIREEMDLVRRETDRLFRHAGIPVALKPDLTELLVTCFQELRHGKTIDGKSFDSVSTVISTAEAVNVGFSAGVHAYYLSQDEVGPEHVLQGLLGTALKDSPDDVPKLRHYFNQVVRPRRDPLWKRFYEAREALE